MMKNLIDKYGDIRWKKSQDKELANIINEISLNLDDDTVNKYKGLIQQTLYEIIFDLNKYKKNKSSILKILKKNESSILTILKKMDYVDPNATNDIIYDDVDLLYKIQNDLKFDDQHIKNLL